MPGDIAEMMLDGTLCEACGTYMGHGSGFPGYCSKRCAKDRGAGLEPATDAECFAYLDDLEPDELAFDVSHYLRIFLGVGKKRSKRLTAEWRASKTVQDAKEG